MQSKYSMTVKHRQVFNVLRLSELWLASHSRPKNCSKLQTPFPLCTELF